MNSTTLAVVALALALVAVPAIVLAGGGSADPGGPETAAATVDVVEDATISLSPADGSNGQYATVNGDEELVLQFESLNDDAVTTAHDVFEINVTAAEPARIRVEGDTPGVSYYWEDDPTTDANESRTVAPGESISVGVRADSHGEIDGGTVTVIAEGVGAGNGTAGSGGGGGGGAPPVTPDPPDDEGLTTVDATVSPRELTAGESATVTATVANSGAEPATRTVELVVDGVVVDQRTVTVPGGATETITFERQFQQAGEFAVAAGGIEAGTVTVRQGTQGFEVSNASVSPGSIQPGGTATITADVTNRGPTEDVFTAELSIGGVVVEERAVRVGAGETEQVRFDRTFERRGGYEVAIGGADAGTLQVESATGSALRRYGSQWQWLVGAATVPTLGAAFVAARRRGKLVLAED